MLRFLYPAGLAVLVCTAPAAAQTPVDSSALPAARPGAAPAVEMPQVAPDPVPPGFAPWIRDFRKRALGQGIRADIFDRAFASKAYRSDVIEKDRNQAEFNRQIWDYLDRAVSDDRVDNGQAALQTHAQLLDRIAARYGVEREVVTAIWGIESAYGTRRGDIPVIDALATLAFDGRRGRFFEEQLVAALQILHAGDTTPGRMTGSWAGAMGHTQFIPTSYLAYAVDFTGDGRRDIWSEDPADALASTAAYLARFGWTKGQPWGVEVVLPEGFDYTLTGKGVKKRAADWTKLGVRSVGGGSLPDHGSGAILLPAGAGGAAFLIFDNFRTIARYNNADSYVIAVGHLADRLKGGPPISADWPRSDRALTFQERVELQERLTRAGFSTRGADGILGPNSIAALRAWQKAQGLVPDGYASLGVLERLR